MCYTRAGEGDSSSKEGRRWEIAESLLASGLQLSELRRGVGCLVNDACTELSQDMHEAALLSFSHLFDQVRTTQELIEFLELARPQSAAAETSFAGAHHLKKN
jgi:hypothetical protein